jgi:hypothetical protein
MQYVNASLTLWTQRLQDRADWLLLTLRAILMRAARTAFDFAVDALRVARVFFSTVLEAMDAAQQAIFDRIYERRMAVRGFFLVNPRDQHSEYTRRGRKVLAYWARHAHALAPIQTTDPMTMAKAEGKRELFALIIADLFDDLPDFARLMAQEEARQLEEIVST